MKGVYQRGKKWWLRHYYGGHELREPLHTTDEVEAIVRARAILDNPKRVKSGVFAAELDAYFADRVADEEMRATTVAARRPVLMSFAQRFAIASPYDIRPDHVQKWHADLKMKKSRNTADFYARWLRSFCRWLVDNGKLGQNPCDDVRIRQPSYTPKGRVADGATIRRLIDECTDKQLKLILLLGFDCGLRKAEIIEARPEWFDLAVGSVQVQASATWQPKDKEERVIPLTDRLLSFIRTEFPAGMPSPFLIAPEKEPQLKPHHGRSVNRYRYDPERPFRAYMAAQGCEWITFKVMRESFGSTRVSGGAELAKVSRWMGHSKLQTTMDHYIRFSPRDEAINKGI